MEVLWRVVVGAAFGIVHQYKCRKLMRSNWMALCFAYLLGAAVVVDRAQSQESPLYMNSPYNTNVTYRTNVCHRFEAVEKGELPFRRALEGLELAPLLRPGSQFYLIGDGDDDHEMMRIDRQNPGMIPHLLDEIANRGGFTWRNSFGIYYSPGENKTWTELILAGIQKYDFIADYWAVTSERLGMGVSYPHGYFDTSLILVGEKLEGQTRDEIVLLNWLEPFDSRVWVAMLFTVVYSAMVYTFLEYCGHEDNDRSLGEWLLDNFYHSSLLMTQNFEFAPNTVATRFFAISMALWGLLITTTYTANLASFFLTKSTIQRQVSSIDQAVELGYTFCTWKTSWDEVWLLQNYPTARVLSFDTPTPQELFEGVVNGDCDFAVTMQSSFETFAANRFVNANCTLEPIGEKYVDNSGAFALLADSGDFCTSLIRDVVNLILEELELEGVIAELWSNHLRELDDNYCGGMENADLTLTFTANGRRLKAAKTGGAAGGAVGSADGQRLNSKHLAGSFLLHAILSVIAILLSYYGTFNLQEAEDDDDRRNNSETKPCNDYPLDASHHDQIRVAVAMKLLEDIRDDLTLKLNDVSLMIQEMNENTTPQQKIACGQRGKMEKVRFQTKTVQSIKKEMFVITETSPEDFSSSACSFADEEFHQ